MTTIASVSRKRKRDEEKVLLGEPFVIQPHLSSVFDTSLKITPAVLFPRKYVPLNWLTGVPSRLFSAYIPALDSPGNILITKTDGERQLSAMERVAEGVFTLFKLSPLVKMKDVRRLAQLARKAQSPTPECVGVGKKCLEKDWWTDLVLGGCSTGMAGTKGQTAVLSMMHPSKQKHDIKSTLYTEASELRLLSPPSEVVFKEPTPSEVLEQIKSQYLEALYVAKTSIAYFAKSTLSRARVKFQLEASEESPTSPNTTQLVEFLQSLIIPLDKMDTKYRKVIVQVATEEAIEDTTIFKIGEEFYVQRWLSMNFKDKVLQSSDPVLRRQTEDLKIRETELQIILLLEILALTKDKTAPTEPDNNEKKKKKNKKKSSSKKKQKGTEPPDCSILLDLLLDRLCIWRSIGSLEPPVEGERPKSSDTKEGGEGRLKNFCIEVVMPFYSSRLPEICSSIQKKIGGTNAPPESTRKPSIEPKRRKVASLLKSHTTPASTVASRNSTPVDLMSLSKTTSKNVDLGAVAKKTLQKREIRMPALNVKPAVNVEEELKDAIKALSRPNRVAAGVEIMDAATKRLSAGGSVRKQKKPVRNPNANSVLVHATPSKKNRSQQRLAVQSMPPQDEEDEDEDSFLPPNRPSQQRNTQAAIFDSPIKKSNKLYPFSQSLYLSRSALLHTADMVPESSPGQVPNTPLKGFSTVGRKAGLSLGARYMEDDSIPESSPIKPTRSINHLARSRSCLFPSKPKLDDIVVRDSSPLHPLIVGTPQKRKRLPFQDDDEDEMEKMPSSIGRLEAGLGSSVSVDQTPVRTRPLSRAATFGPSSINPSTRLDFSTLAVVADSPVKARGGGSRDLKMRSLRFSVNAEDEDEVVTGKPPAKKAFAENVKEVDIYKSLGWDDDDESLL